MNIRTNITALAVCSLSLVATAFGAQRAMVRLVGPALGAVTAMGYATRCDGAQPVATPTAWQQATKPFKAKRDIDGLVASIANSDTKRVKEILKPGSKLGDIDMTEHFAGLSLDEIAKIVAFEHWMERHRRDHPEDVVIADSLRLAAKTSPNVQHEQLFQMIIKNDYRRDAEVFDDAIYKMSDAHKRTALHIAVVFNRSVFVGLLVRKGVPINAGDYQGRTPLHTAAALGRPDMIGELILFGANVNAKTTEYEKSPLHFAAIQGDTRTVTYLLKAGAVVDAIQKYEHETPLKLAIAYRHEKVVRILLSYGASTDTLNDTEHEWLETREFRRQDDEECDPHGDSDLEAR